MPERFARNTRFLLNTFSYKQEALARGIGMSASTFSRYMNGTRAELEFSQYVLAAEHLISDICQSKEETEYFFKLTGLGKPEGFDFSDFKLLSSDAELIKKLGADLLREMKARDFAAGDNEGQNKRPQSKRSRLIKIAGLVMLACAAAFAVYLLFFAPPKVTLTITGSSVVGEADSYVTGTVTVSRGSPEDYAVTVAIVSAADGRTYAPKPSLVNPTVPVTLTETRGTGNFTCTLYADIDARIVYVYVVPVGFVPDHDTERTENASAVWVEHIRD